MLMLRSQICRHGHDDIKVPGRGRGPVPWEGGVGKGSFG